MYEPVKGIFQITSRQIPTDFDCHEGKLRETSLGLLKPTPLENFFFVRTLHVFRPRVRTILQKDIRFPIIIPLAQISAGPVWKFDFPS